MAEGKKSFVLYSDFSHLFSELSDEEAGKLIKHIFSYVNDEDPQTDNRIVNLAFQPIKQQLKRDLLHWNNIKEKRSEAGKASVQAKKERLTKSTSVESVQQTSTNSTVNDNVNVNVNERERIAPAHAQVKEFFYISRRSGWSDARCTIEATDFCDHYESVGWRVSGQPIVNWQARARKWINDPKSDKKNDEESKKIKLK